MENLRANELRIGNLVLRKAFLPENNNYHEITATHHDIEACVHSFAEFEPIPLTEEWLLKFGFEQKGSFYRIKNNRFAEIIVHDDGIDVCNHSVYLPHIKSVHQLQNLYFALTGCELEIK